VLAEGPRRALELLLKKLKAGPAAACVEHVDAEWEKESGEFEGFEIR
jgi:acylphosphatase